MVGTHYSTLDINNTLDISFHKNFLTSVSANDRYDMCELGTYIYTSDNGIDGIKVEWADGSTEWSTDNGTANQNGSVFTITERGSFPTGTFDFNFTIKGSFSCNLYDLSGNMITVENATFSGQVNPF